MLCSVARIRRRHGACITRTRPFHDQVNLSRRAVAQASTHHAASSGVHEPDNTGQGPWFPRASRQTAAPAPHAATAIFEQAAATHFVLHNHLARSWPHCAIKDASCRCAPRLGPLSRCKLYRRVEAAPESREPSGEMGCMWVAGRMVVDAAACGNAEKRGVAPAQQARQRARCGSAGAAGLVAAPAAAAARGPGGKGGACSSAAGRQFHRALPGPPDAPPPRKRPPPPPARRRPRARQQPGSPQPPTAPPPGRGAAWTACGSPGGSVSSWRCRAPRAPLEGPPA